jgi:hypothetical protein
MRRRDVLCGLAGAAALPLARPVSATPTATAPAPLATLRLPGAKEVVVSTDGRYAFVAVTNGFAVVDLADPAAPEVVFEDHALLAGREDGPLTGVYDCKLDGDLLAVCGPADRIQPLMGVIVYDVSDPTAPERLSVHETDFINHNCHIDEGILYLCGIDWQENPLVTVDAETGEELGRWSILEAEPGWTETSPGLWPLHDVWTQDGVAYLAYWDAGTWMVDVSDPAAPELIGKVRGPGPAEFRDMPSDEARRASREPPGNDHFAMPNDDGTMVAISVEAWDIDPQDPQAGPGAVHLYDVSDPASPAEVAVIEAPESPNEAFDGVWTTSHNFEWRGDRLYTSWYRGGVRVYDVSDPANPIERFAWQDADHTSFWTAQVGVPDEFFVAGSRTDPEGSDGAALYTFPDVDATGSSPGSTPTPTPTETPPTPTATPDTGTSPSTPTPGTPATETPSPTEHSASSSGGPGFGPAAALLGVGLGAWRVLRNRDED